MTLEGDYLPHAGQTLRVGATADGYGVFAGSQSLVVPPGGAVSQEVEVPFDDTAEARDLVWWVDVDGDGLCTGSDAAWSYRLPFTTTTVRVDASAARDPAVCDLIWD